MNNEQKIANKVYEFLESVPPRLYEEYKWDLECITKGRYQYNIDYIIRSRKENFPNRSQEDYKQLYDFMEELKTFINDLNYGNEIKRLKKLLAKKDKTIEKLTGEIKYFNHLIENSNISSKGY